MSQYIAGIEPTAPAFRRFRVSPHPAHLNQIRAVVPLSGKREIRLSLDKDSRRCDIVLEVPQGTEACFCLPDGYTGMSVNSTVCQSAEKVLTPGVWNIRLTQAGDYASK